MACCVVGAMLTAALVGTLRFVRRRVLHRPDAAEAASWRLHARSPDARGEQR
jgi:hypothetical protein